ncbi:MAG: ABC transporter ATP-binding protein [Patescibacteria group bacterium]
MLSNQKIAISINHVSKLFHKQNQRTFKELIPAFFGRKSIVESFWALKDINLEIKKGERIGIIGPNGSGKSTLLKLIAGVTEPTKGEIIVKGRIAPLIELGAGFHPELTGRENVFLNSIILGMSRKEVELKFKKIVDFAELWDFIDSPIKHYSSGMYLRLAFAVAIHTKLEILLVDEILAVGDAKFQQKCLARLQEFKSDNITIIYVSHNIQSILDSCEKGLYLKEGKTLIAGKIDDVVRLYSQDMERLECENRV